MSDVPTSARGRYQCSQCSRIDYPQARVDGQVICASCQKRWLNSKALCSYCGQIRRPARGRANAGLCEPCAGNTNTQICGLCGAEEKLYASARCTACYLQDEIARMRADGNPAAVAQLADYLDALALARPANSVLHWLRTSRTSAAPILRDLLAGTRSLTHQALDELPDNHSVSFLRAALVRHSALPYRDELTHRFEQWIETILSTLPDHPDRSTLRRWAIWVVLHDLRARREASTKPVSDKYSRTLVRVARDFVTWIHAQKLTLASTHQEHVDRWVMQGTSTQRAVGLFLKWTSKGGLTPALSVYRNADGRRGDELAEPERLKLLGRLIEDETLELRSRVVGLLILLYGQPLARIARMRTEQIHHHQGQTSLLLGRDQLALPEPIDGLFLQLAREPQGSTLHGRQAGDWLFPGQIAGAPITGERLRRRLKKQLGELPVRRGRNGAVMNLLRDVPAPVLADLLGFSQNRVHLWAELAAGNYTSYIAARHGRQTPCST